MLELRNVGKFYAGTPAVEDVSFGVRKAEFVTLLGPSGSGKSTILGMVAGFLTPDAGSIVLDGRDVRSLSAARRAIGVVFQHYALFPHMNVADNIAYGLKRRRWPKQRIRERVGEMLSLIGLEGYDRRRPSQLSGGEQQRVALARALAFKPKVLLMDEPLGALDREIRLQMQEEIRRIHHELQPTILYVTHNKEEAFALSDRVGIMRKARLVAIESPTELYENPPSVFVASFFAGRQIFELDALADASIDEPAIPARGDTTAPSAVLTTRSRAAVGQKIAVSPQAVQIEPRENRSASGSYGEHLSLHGHVADLVYMGHATQVHCHIQPGGQIIVSEMKSSDAATLTVGQEVWIGVDLASAVVLPG